MVPGRKVYAGTGLGQTFTGRSNGVYRYRISAVKNGQTSEYGYSSNITVSRAPAVPTGLSIPTRSSSGSYTVSWNAVSGAEHYTLEESGNGSGSWTQSEVAKSFSKSLNGAYSYRVRACKVYEKVTACSAYTAKAKVQVSQPILKVQSISGQGAVSLLFNMDWRDAQSCELRRDSVVIHRAAKNKGAIYVDTVRSSGTYHYSYSCKKCLQGNFPNNCTEPESVGSANTTANVALTPSVPHLSIASSINSTDGSAAFKSISSISTGPIERVRWQVRASGGTWPAHTSYTESATGDGSFRVAELGDGSWDLRTKNCNISGCSSSWSNAVTVRVLHKPLGDFSISFSGNFAEGNYSVNWSADSGLVENYHLREIQNGFLGEWLDRGAARIYSPLAKPDGDYSYEIYACNSSGCSGTVTSQLLTITHPVPAAPTNLVAAQTNREIHLTWDKVTTGFDDDYEFRLNGEGWRPANTSTTASQPIGSYGRYTFDVRACNRVPAGRKCSDFATTTHILPDPDPTSPGWAKAMGGLGILDAGDTALQPSAHQETLGFVSGTGGVSGGGAAYQLPIELPPGRQGMQPAISLGYSSRSGNGVLGKGWTLNAGSGITRCAQTMAQDGQMKPVQYLASDRLCLDGQRLLAVSGRYGASGATYHTERDENARVTQFGSLNGTDTWFKVELKNGRVRFYGDNTDSRHSAEGVDAIKVWAISFEQDRALPSSNSINYVYRSFGRGEYQLDEIYYTGTGQQNGDRRVSFEYESGVRPDIASAYLKGGLTRQSKRLGSIGVYVQGALLREYRFDYHLSEAIKSSLLDNIRLCAQGGSCFAPTKLEWADASETMQTEILGAASFNGGNHLNSGKSISALFPEQKQIERLIPKGDFNGDGVRDWPGHFISAEGESLGTFNANLDGCLPVSREHHCVELDANSDGKTDALRISGGKLQIGFSDGSGGVDWLTTSLSLADTGYVLDARDYNGDGWADLQIRRGNPPNNYKLYLYLHTGNAQAPYKDNGQLVTTFGYDSLYFGYTSFPEFVGDITGNGLPDILLYTTKMELNPVGEISAPQPVPSEFLFTVGDKRHVSFVPVNTDTPPSKSRFYFYYLLDINGDGLKDWINWRGDRSGFYYRLNKGGTFTDWRFAASEKGMEYRTYRYFNRLDLAWETFHGLKYVDAFKAFDQGADGRMELIYPRKRLVESCSEIHDGGSKKKRCGDELYKPFNSGTPGNPSYGHFDVNRMDNSLYEFEGLRFIEQADGSFKIEQYDTKLVGTAYNSAIIDAFGNGLQDFVCSFMAVRAFLVAARFPMPKGIPRGCISSAIAAPPRQMRCTSHWICWSLSKTVLVCAMNGTTARYLPATVAHLFPIVVSAELFIVGCAKK